MITIERQKSVFVSYASGDQKIAEAVVKELKDLGLAPFFAPHDIPARPASQKRESMKG